ncbi:sensor domain-containing protein [Actinoplanes sp. NPDC051851]|uniref:sensor domain-containing protein n=1 Tax=Actinoplanes sp. NPDC051851 TaxID=3154753 RepID=UPI0034153657
MTTTYLDEAIEPAPVERYLTRAARMRSDTRYVLTGFPVGLAGIVLCFGGFAIGLGLAALWIGVPLAVGSMLLARGMAIAERARIARVLGEPSTAPLYRGGSRRQVLTDPQSWRDLAHAMLRFVPSTIATSLVVSWWAGLLGGLSWALWGWALPDGPQDHDVPGLLGLGDGYLTGVGFYLVVAAFFALTLPTVTRAAAVLEARFAQGLLVRP